MSKRILVVGIGNELRGDDGIGAYICRMVETKQFKNVGTLIIQQLHTELVEDFLSYDHIIIADASVGKEDFLLAPLPATGTSPVSSSHHINASMLSAIAKQLYKKELSIMICSVKAQQFEMGAGLSDIAKENAGKAAGTLFNWIRSISD